MRRSFLLFFGTVGLMACPASPPNDICGYGICTDGGGDGGQETDAPPNCDLTKDPKDSPACVADSVGVFVDATNGKDTNAGTKAAPMQTIGAALGKTAALKRLYVCEGTYAEDVTLDASHDGVSIYGGWKCADWSYTGGKPQLGKSSLALKLDSLTKDVALEDLSVKSADGVADGQSSVAAFVNASTAVTFTRVLLTAGAGKNAKDAVQQPPVTKASDGTSSTGNPGGAQCKNTCPDGDSIGGKGGDVGSANAADGQPSYGGTYPNNGGHGTDSTSCGSGGGGGTGVQGPNGGDQSGASMLGALTSTGWTPAGGTAGLVGARSQGGGGGGARAGGGGAGGCGGCGGQGASPGGGGGASIALVVLSSTVSLTASQLTATTSGNGAAGALGQLGQPPGAGAGGYTGASPNGCGGGDGAAGGSGGAGGGGAGGISVGVLWKGSAPPTIDSTTTSQTTVASKGGSKGAGGKVGTNDGIDGIAQAILQSP